MPILDPRSAALIQPKNGNRVSLLLPNYQSGKVVTVGAGLSNLMYTRQWHQKRGIILPFQHSF